MSPSGYTPLYVCTVVSSDGRSIVDFGLTHFPTAADKAQVIDFIATCAACMLLEIQKYNEHLQQGKESSTMCYHLFTQWIDYIWSTEIHIVTEIQKAASLPL